MLESKKGLCWTSNKELIEGNFLDYHLEFFPEISEK
jgi:hypothetical protein